MNIHSIGGEFALIEQLSKRIPTQSDQTIVSIGDDAAVLELAPSPAPYTLVTTDLLSAGRHFNTQWATADQIGQKAVESNVSDIAAMGGVPSWMFISLALPSDCGVEWTEGLYDGIAHACRRHGIVVAGGDTTQADVTVINITLMGHVEPSNLCLRSHAKVGDVVMVTGTLGRSAAALEILERGGVPDGQLLKNHLTPRCRLDVSRKIAPLANAMIDISDGLGSDLRHICGRSKVSAEIRAADLPMHSMVLETANRLELDPMTLVLAGGEDFQLLFSVPEAHVAGIMDLGIDCRPIGTILPGNEPPTLLMHTGERKPLPAGYDHFA